MGIEATALGLEPGTHRLGLDDPGQRGDLGLSRAEAKPDDPSQPDTLERADLAQPQIASARVAHLDPIRDAFRKRKLDVAEKANRQMEVGGRRPAKVRRKPGAFLDVRIERRAMALGQGKPEERAD